MLFSENSATERRNRLENSKSAALITSNLDELIGFRISLQRPLDIVQHFPVTGPTLLNVDELQPLSELIENILQTKIFLPNKKDSNKSLDASWESLFEAQKRLEGNSDWAAVLNKWHSRINFGSEHVKSKLKVFNKTLWDQIEDIVADESRVIEKSRIPLSESCRVDKINMKSAAVSEENADTDYDEEEIEVERATKKQKTAKEFDLEVYDDRNFYAHLLKSFIMNSSNSTSLNGSSMRAADLQALKNFKKRKTENVERKASKGRKIRYKVHEKLQHFMFPIPAVPPAGLDVDRLMASLFQ